MRRGCFVLCVLALIAVFIFFLMPASALYSCSDDQTILKLSSQTNAHGELWNNGMYATEVCFNEIFNGNGDGSRSTGLVLRLYGAGNAHAESPSLNPPFYTTEVKYGGLTCSGVRGNCSGQYAFVVALNSDSNGHISLAKTSSYGLAICCKASGLVPKQRCGNGNVESGEQCDLGDQSLGGMNGVAGSGCDSNCFIEGQASSIIREVYWADGSGKKITESCVNKTVFLVAKTSYTGAINYDVYRAVTGADVRIRTRADGNSLTANAKDGKAMASWKILDSNMGGGETSNFYFNASSISSSNVSINLPVVSKSCANEKPTAVIKSPKHRQMYFAGMPLEFNESSYDADGTIAEYEWVIENRAGIEYTTKNRSFLYTFSNGGQRTITLKVTDNAGKTDETQIAILELGSPGLLGFINEPKHKQMIINERILNIYGTTQGVYVNFDASDSYVVNVEQTGCATTIACLAGNCPSKTENSLAGCSQTSVSGTPKNFDKIYFNWTFEDSNPDRLGGYGLTSPAKLYLAASESNKAMLNLTYSDSGINIAGATLRIFGLNSQCRAGTLFFLNDSRGFLDNPLNTANDGVACAGADRTRDTLDDCCPAEFQCTSTGCARVEVVEEDGRKDCGKYDDQERCNDDINRPLVFRAAKPENYPGGTWGLMGCGTTKTAGGKKIYTYCQCGWDSNECKLKAYQTNTTIPGDSEDGPVIANPNPFCSYSYSLSEPEGGYCTASADASCLAGDCGADCNDISPYTVACGRQSIKLPFFGLAQFFIASLLIGILYALMFRKR